MLLIIPVNWKVSSISKRWTLQQMKLKDERIRLSNEVLSGIKVTTFILKKTKVLGSKIVCLGAGFGRDN